MRIGHAQNIDGVIFVSECPPLVIEHNDIALPQRLGHLVFAIDVIVIAQNCVAAMAAGDPRQQFGHHIGRHPPAAKQLHVDVIAAKQRQVGLERRSLAGDRRIARQIAGMRTNMQIGEQHDPQRTPEARPARQRQRITADDMRLRAQ